MSTLAYQLQCSTQQEYFQACICGCFFHLINADLQNAKLRKKWKFCISILKLVCASIFKLSCKISIILKISFKTNHEVQQQKQVVAIFCCNKNQLQECLCLKKRKENFGVKPQRKVVMYQCFEGSTSECV